MAEAKTLYNKEIEN